MPVHYDPGGGGALAVTSFADTMISGGTTLAGPNYFPVYSPGNGTTGSDIDAQINPSASGLVMGSGSGVNNNATRIAFFPIAIDNTAMRAGSLSRGQMAQWTLVSRAAGIDCECPLICFGDPAGSNGGYIMTVQSESNNVSLAMGWGSAVFYTVRANCFNCVPGDVVRMEVTFATAQNTIRTFKNGTLQSTDTDNNALRPAGGLAGFGLLGVFTGVLVFKNFSVGLL